MTSTEFAVPQERPNLPRILFMRIAMTAGGAVLIGLAYWHTIQISENAARAAVDPGLWPRIAVVLLACSSCVALLTRPGQDSDMPAFSEHDATSSSRTAAAFFMAALGYALMLGWLGFVIATPPFLFLVAALAGVRRPVIRLVHAVTGTIGGIVLFAGFLNAPMPRGSLGFAYELSSSIYFAVSSLAVF